MKTVGFPTKMQKRPIGIFDSGIGGLTVLREIERVLPFEDIIYFGDTARVPYGNKSQSTIIKFSRANVHFLLQKKVKIIVVACNTSSALALEYLRKEFSIPIIGVIKAGVIKALEITSGKKIGVIGTRSTIESRSYEREIFRLNGKVKVYSQSCPLFVPLAEEGVIKGKIIRETVKMYLGGLKLKKIDTLILGCTHYPLLKKEISHFLKEVRIVDSAREVACYVKNILDRKGFLRPVAKKSRIEFYLSDKSDNFIQLAEIFLQRKASRPTIINI